MRRLNVSQQRSTAVHQSTTRFLRSTFQPRSSLCDWRAHNVAIDTLGCNDLKEATPLFLALLRHVHPKTEALFLREVIGFKGDRVTLAFFIGKAGKAQILIDLSRVNAAYWTGDKAFELKAYSGDGLGEIARTTRILQQNLP